MSEHHSVRLVGLLLADSASRRFGSDKALAEVDARPGVGDRQVVDDVADDAVARDGQARVWWDNTPVDLFFDTTD